MGIASLPLKDFDPHQLNSKNYALVKNYLENNCTFSFMQCRTKYLDFFQCMDLCAVFPGNIWSEGRYSVFYEQT